MESEMRYQALVQRTLERERNGINPVRYFALETLPCICCERPSSKWLSELRANFMPDRDTHEYSSSDDFENSAEINGTDVNEEFRAEIQDSSCCSKQGSSRVRVEEKTSRKRVSSNYKDNFCDKESAYRGSQQESLTTPDEIMVESPKNIAVELQSDPELKIRNGVKVSSSSEKNVDTKINSSEDSKEDELMMDKRIPDFDKLFYNLQQQSSGCGELSSEDRTDISLDSQINFNHKAMSNNFESHVPVKNMMIPLIEDLLCASEGESSTAGELLIEKSRNTSLGLQKNVRSKFEQTKNSNASLKEQSKFYDSEELAEMLVESSSFKHQKIENPEDPTDEEGVKRLLTLSINLDSYEILPPVIGGPYVEKVTGPIWKNSDYKKVRDEIYSKISFNYKSCIIVWCPLLDTRCDLVHTVLPKYGKIITAHDRWMRPEYGLTEETWGGVFVAYATEKEAKLAAKEIPKNYRHIKTLQLSILLHCLIKSELQLFKQEKPEPTDVFVNLSVSSNLESQQHLKSLLFTFGEVEPEDCYNAYGRFSIQYKMAYTCAAYGFLAMTVLDGHPFRPSTLKVEVKETPKETAILKDILWRLRKYTGGAYFPFNGMP